MSKRTKLLRAGRSARYVFVAVLLALLQICLLAASVVTAAVAGRCGGGRDICGRCSTPSCAESIHDVTVAVVAAVVAVMAVVAVAAALSLPLL